MLLLLVSACSAPRNAQEEPSSQTADEDDLEALYWERQRQARSSFTKADVHFMAGMIGHHAQALVMSRLAPKRGASEDVQTLAARIINAQRDEIATMQRWLRERGQPVPEVHIDGLNLTIRGGGDMDHTDMPGMLSQKQLQELSDAHGAAFDRLFLKYMIQHHKGAVTMVDDLLDTDGAAQDEAAFNLASDIHADQTTEIARMQRMLDDLSETTR